MRRPSHRRPGFGRATQLAAAAAAAFLASVTPASAGTFRVWSCKTPAGAATSVEGWTPSSTIAGSAATETCAAAASRQLGLRVR